MTTDIKLTVVYRPVEDGWIQARLVELPGVITTSRDLGHARSMIRDALVEYLSSFHRCEIAVPAGGEIEEIEIEIPA